MARVLLLCNPSASSVTPRGRVVIQAALAADHELSVVETSRRGHATRLAQGAAASGTEVVVVLGGDGTLNETANGLAGTSTALACLPGGSTNVFARTIGLPNDPIEATGDLIGALRRGSRQRIGLGVANGRYFMFHVGAGFDAAVVEQVEKRGGLKRYAGHALFVAAGLSTWFRHYDRDHAAFAVHHEDGTVIEDAYLTICLKTDPYTFLGRQPLSFSKTTGLHSPLAMLTFRSLRFNTLLGTIASALASGRRLRNDKKLDRRVDIKSATLIGHRPFPYQLDGDYLGETERLELAYEPDCLDLVVP